MKNPTKSIIFILIISLITINCKNEPSRDELVKSKIEETVLKNLDDPESYEFVELTLLDSTTNKDNYENSKDVRNYLIDTDKRLLMIDPNGDNTMLEESIKKMEEELLEIDEEFKRIESKNQQDSVVAYKYLFKARANNKLGAKVLNSMYVSITPDLKIVDANSDEENLGKMPNSFFNK